MKSRKPAKVSNKSRRGDRNRKTLQGAIRSFETLEDRKLLTVAPWSDGLYYPPIGIATAFLPPSITPAQYASISSQQFGGGGSSGGGSGSNQMFAEGTQPFFNGSEVEPNDVFSQAVFVNLGTLPTQSDGAALVGNLTAPTLPGGNFVRDTDWYAFDLRAGDIFDARINAPLGTAYDLSILDAGRKEVIGNTGVTGILGTSPYPLGSPLDVTSTNPTIDLAFVVPTTGRYYARVSDGDSAYTLTMRVRRPELESQPVGTKQKLFLDFDGEFLRRDIFDPAITGTARLSPLSNFLAGWGLTAADENQFIDKVISIFKSKFFGTSALSGIGGNGWYTATGAPGQFDIEILNSRDHADPFGEPNVSRIIFGGSVAELGIGTVGIAQSIDVGNFVQEESAVVLLDSIAPLWGAIPRAGNVPLQDILADAIASVGVHEAGHFFGAWHTLNNNATDQIMDTGGNVTGLIGVGADGVYGTADDRKVHFGTDTYDAGASAIPFGRQNSAAAIAFGLSTGTVGGSTIRGNVYQDTNSNRVRDTGDLPLAGVAIYNDVNNNGLIDVNEQRTFSDANGNYVMTVPAGYYILRELVPTGQKLVAPNFAAHVFNIADGQTLTGRDFINEKVNATINGVKWNDLDGDGVRNTGEPTISGVYIYIDLDGDNRIDIGEPAAQTAANGTYKLTFPGPGTYTIREVPQPGFTQTLPGPTADEEYTITLTGNPTIDAPRLSGLDFGNQLKIDFGDAPATYGSAGAGFVAGLTLGTAWDAEGTPLFSVGALGDDDNGVDDEDAINIAGTRPLTIGSSNNPVTVLTTNTTGQNAYLQAWIDFNGDGIFGADEQIVTNQLVTNGPLPAFNVTVPPTAQAGNTFARLRLSTSQNVGATGQTLDGEVEDYPISLRPDLVSDAVNDTAVVRRNSVLNPIDVLANDFRLSGEVLEVVNVSESAADGLVTFTATGVLYTPPAGFIGRDTFTYQMRNSSGDTFTATVTVDVILFFDNPLAIDDSFEVPTNAIDFPLNVLANDIEGDEGALSIISVTQPDKGGNLSIATGNKSLRYTPSRDFNGTEFFTYTVSDAAGNTSIAQGTIHLLPGNRATDEVLIRLVATDLAGTPIARIQQGQQFKVDMYVDDLRFDTANPSPELSAGVFAAYTDLLYNLQLVSTVLPTASTPSGFNFDVSFFNNYVNGNTGDGAIPGIINELGGFFDGSNMNRPNEVRLASVTFQAKTPGIASFLADPADASPASNLLLFNRTLTPVSIDNVLYRGTTIEIVGDGVVFPAAIDDSVEAIIPVNAVQVPINVLANDLPGSSGPLALKPTGLGTPINGTAVVSGGRILYTPRLGFSGSDQFTYTAVDTLGNETVARVTVKVGNNTGADDIVTLPLRVTDLSGATITQVAVGQQFQLRGYVQDLRTTGTQLGIFSAYQDVVYSSSFASPVVSSTNPLGFEVTFGPNYQRVLEGDVLTRGLFNEIGAVATSNSEVGYGATEHLLFTITMTANAIGTASFNGDPADISPLHDTLTFVPTEPVGFGQVRYGLTSVAIVGATTGGGTAGEFTNNSNPYDVNADGFISPIDALAIINALNSGGARSLVGSAGGEGESTTRFYIDTNGDGLLSPMDALGVINVLNENSRSNRAGEGEGESSGSQQSLSASDAVYSDDLFDDGVDQLISQLAPEIEQTWKKARS